MPRPRPPAPSPKPLPTKSRLSSPFLHPSLYLSLLFGIFTLVALVSFTLALIQQATYTGSEKRWNIVIITGLTAGTAGSSVILILGRVIGVRRAFRSMPRPYIPIKNVDVPRDVANHIATEYSRTAMIVYISQPTAGKQEGWGRPGSQFSGIHFRTRIRATYPILLSTLNTLLPPPNPPVKVPRASSASAPLVLLLHPMLPPTALPLIKIYLEQLEAARYARSEPTEEAFERCMKIVALLIGLIQTSSQTTPLPALPPPPTTHSSQTPPISSHFSTYPSPSLFPRTARRRRSSLSTALSKSVSHAHSRRIGGVDEDSEEGEGEEGLVHSPEDI